MNPLLREVLPVLGLDEAYAVGHLDLAAGSALPAALPVGTLAAGSVAAAGLAGLAMRGGERVRVDPFQVAVSFRSDQLQAVDGVREPGFAPLSGFFEAGDGWVRTHANYPHHRLRLLQALGLGDSATRADAAAVMRERTAQELEDAIVAHHGIGVRVRELGEWRAHPQATAVDRHPLLAVGTTGAAAGGAPTPLRDRPRVLDLTRVIAGPVATRTLAFLGCDVLRVDSPHLSELPLAHLDTDAGKRSTLADLHDQHARRRIHELLDTADVLVTGYRPGALAAFGLDPDRLAQSHPTLVCASLSAWTPGGPWGGRRGFDSIVQAATGVAVIESADDRTPGSLPAQALDHATGYLLAAGVAAALRQRAAGGGTWRVAAHLARTAHWLLQTDALDAPGAPVDDPAPYLVTSSTPSGVVTSARPALQVDGGTTEFAWVGRHFGTDEAAWT